MDIPLAEVAIIGAGPIGIELATALKRADIDYLHFEAKQIGYTISWWPRNTYFFSTTERIEIAGIPIPNQTQGRTSGEAYLAYLRGVVEQLDLQINTYEPVVEIHKKDDVFLLKTQTRNKERTYLCKNVVLAKGDMDKPNILGIPGEDLPHVSHYFKNVHLYFRKRLLIVGGRNSAVEGALRCWRAGANVSISYRREKFDPQVVKHWLLPDIEAQIDLGTIGYFPLTVPVEITPEHVILERIPDQKRFTHPTDFVLLATGYVADMSLFRQAGVNLCGLREVPDFNPETMQTNVPGVYVAGTAAAGAHQGGQKYTLFLENTHEHVGKIVKQITGKWPDKLGSVSPRQYDLPLEDIQSN